MLGRLRSLVVLALLSMLAAVASGEATAATITWTGTAGDGLWHTAGNWDLARLPAPGDDVVIPNLPGTASVTHGANVEDVVNSLTCAEPFVMPTGKLTLSAASSFSNGLVLSNATIGGTGDVTISGPGFDWRSGGTFAGTGTLTISPGVTWTSTGIGQSSLPILQRPLDNFGTLLLVNDSGMLLAAPFRNRAGGVVQWMNDGLIDCTGGFENQAGATFTRTAGAGTARLQSGSFTNAGSVSVQSGTLEFSFITTAQTGSVTVAPAAELNFGGTNATFASGSSLAASGPVNIPSFSNVTFDPAMASLALSSVFMQNGQITIGPDVSVGSLQLQNGTVNGAGDVTVTNAMTWNNVLFGGSGELTIGSLVTWTHSGTAQLDRTLHQFGTGILVGQFLVNASGVFRNRAGGSIDLRTDGHVEGSGTFLNEAGATVRRTTSADIALWRVNTTNDGLFTVQTGGLQPGFSTFTHRGTLTNSPGTLLQVAGTFNAEAGSVTTLGGAFDLVGGAAIFAPNVGALTFGGDVSLSLGTLSIGPNVSIPSLTMLRAPVLTGVGVVTITQSLAWSSGRYSGSG
ncbi:MAG: hypothetical protein U0704_06920, partial [Candidatus Eisenbacteria bacterium]